MENKYTGEIPFTIGDKVGIMVFDYAAMSIIKSNVTQKEFDNLAQLDPEKLALMAAAGFKKKNPEITQEVIMAASPAIMALATAIDRGLLFAYHGPEGAREILEPLDKAQEQFAKRNAKKNSQVTK